MVNSEPNPIKEYYIAYFDILGYKEFFKQQPEKAADLLKMIHNAIQRTNSHIETVNQSVIFKSYGQIEISVKVFSDNILLCMEATEKPHEPMRLLAFLKSVSDIQRGFVTEYGLFVRGGIVKGSLSLNSDYVFGQGLIDAVHLEETAIYPRIVIAEPLIQFLAKEHFNSDDEIHAAINSPNPGEAVSIDTRDVTGIRLYYKRISDLIHYAAGHLAMRWQDGVWIINYLHQIYASDMFGEDGSNALMQALKEVAPDDVNLMFPPLMHLESSLVEQYQKTSLDAVMEQHKKRVTEQLLRYGHNDDIQTGKTELAEVREHILKKYIWAMAYHNRVCNMYQKPDYMILTRCNCDARFLKTTIEVLEDEAGV